MHAACTVKLDPVSSARPLTRCRNSLFISSKHTLRWNGSAQAHRSASCSARPRDDVRLNCAGRQDINEAAAFMGLVFAENDAENSHSWVPFQGNEATLEQSVSIAQTRFEQELRLSMAAKYEAAASMREWAMYRRYVKLQAEIASLRAGRPCCSPPLPDASERRQLDRWRRARKFAVVVARDGSNQLVGCVTISQLQCEAALPPPLPSTRPHRYYVGNLSVDSSRRRQGIASALMQSCCRLGQLWGQDSVWLHVDSDNSRALQLYTTAGFRTVSTIRRPARRYKKEHLLMRPLPLLPRNGDVPTDLDFRGGTSEGGIFVWK